jgi:hypothetical protein
LKLSQEATIESAAESPLGGKTGIRVSLKAIGLHPAILLSLVSVSAFSFRPSHQAERPGSTSIPSALSPDAIGVVTQTGMFFALRHYMPE